jgi:hypothetical protein
MAYLPGTTGKKKKMGKNNETFYTASSTFIQAATYDYKNNSLTIDFKNGTQIEHKSIDPATWDRFRESSSHGSFYARNIKGKYPSVSIQSSLKVSDLSRAIKESRKNANKY